MALQPEDIRRIAHLARLELKEAEVYASYTFKPSINKNSKTLVDDQRH